MEDEDLYRNRSAMESEADLKTVQANLHRLQERRKKLKADLRRFKREKGRPLVAPNKDRAMLPVPEEISSENNPIWVDLAAYEQKEVDLQKMKDAFAAATWRKITNRLCALLGCSGADITIVYATSGSRNGQSVQLLAFKNRINYRFKTLFDSLATSPGGKPSFRPGTCTWTVPDTAQVRKLIGWRLHEYFRYVIDVRAGIALKAKLESPGFRPTFTKVDGIKYTKLLNSVITYAYRAEQTGEKDWERLLRRYKAAGDPFLCSLAGVIPSLGEKILCVLRGELSLPAGKTIREFVLEEYQALSRDVSNRLL